MGTNMGNALAVFMGSEFLAYFRNEQYAEEYVKLFPSERRTDILTIVPVYLPAARIISEED